MPTEITPIPLALPFHLGRVNCYLLEAEAGFILVDTGPSGQRRQLVSALARAGCQPGNLRLILLTHGDFDHIGNAAYLRVQFDAAIAMHPGDAGMAVHGDMFYNRNAPNRYIRWLAPRLFGFGMEQHFVANINLADGFALADYGVAGQVLALPGHSRGSVGILTAEGDLICGDLLDNTHHTPEINSIMDDRVTAQASLAALMALPIHKVYPGHGEPFMLEALRSPAGG